MQITVEYASQVKRAVGVASELFDVDAGAGVDDVLRLIGKRHGEAVRELLFDERQEVHPALLIFHEQARVPAGQQVALSDGDTITIMSAISGG